MKIPYREGYDFGVGVHRASGEPLARGVVGAVTGVDGAPGGLGGLSVFQIDTMQELEEDLGISAEASGGISLFSASARFNYARRCKIQGYSITLILSAIFRGGFRQIDEPELHPNAENIVENEELFFRRYGDSFVRGISSGGIFSGIIRIECSTQEKRNIVQGGISAQYGLIGGDFETTLTELVRQTSSRTFTHIYHEGGSSGASFVQSPRQLIDAGNNWLRTVSSNSTPYEVILAPYVIAVGPNPPNEIDLMHQRDVLKRCAQLRSNYIDFLNRVEYILHPDTINNFENVNLNLLRELRTSFAFDLEIISQAASYALDHARDAREPETFAREIKQLPNYRLTVMPTDMPRLKGGDGKVAPNVLGLSRDEAFRAIRAQGLIARQITVNAGFNNRAFAQRPHAGAPVSIDQRVRFWTTEPGMLPDGWPLEDDLLGSSGVELPEDKPTPPRPRSLQR
jgi:hypothetical protein